MVTNAPEKELEKEELYKKALVSVKKTLDKDILDNPAFEELFYKEFNYYLYKTGELNFEVSVGEGGTSVAIRSNSPVVDCCPEFVGKNRAFLQTIFYIEDDYLVCDFNQGVLLSRKDHESKGERITLRYETKLETTYSKRFFDADGIQLSDNSLTDCYPFMEKIDEVELEERVMSSFHKPRFKVSGFPKAPIHVMKANVRNTYRKYDSLGVIHSNMGYATRTGYQNLVCGLYTCHPSRPELLRGMEKFAEAKGEKNSDLVFKIIDDYAPDLNSAFERAKKEFKDEVLESNIEEFSERTYKALVEKL